jgi:hypothetical protein
MAAALAPGGSVSGWEMERRADKRIAPLMNIYLQCMFIYYTKFVWSYILILKNEKCPPVSEGIKRE